MSTARLSRLEWPPRSRPSQSPPAAAASGPRAVGGQRLWRRRHTDATADRAPSPRRGRHAAAGDFPPVTDIGEAAWATALSELDRQHQNLLGVVTGLGAAKLDEIVPGKPYPVAVMLHGTAQHYGYHAGQIALLKKLLG